MPFGLCGSPGTFQSAMNSTLLPFLQGCVLVFLDNILFYGRTYNDLVGHFFMEQEGYEPLLSVVGSGSVASQV